MFLSKHYLCCVALVLGLSGSAYASKGGKIGSRVKAEIGSKIVNSKLGRTIMAGVFGLTIICSGGCGNGDGVVSPTETEAVQVAEVMEHYNGDNIYFEQGGTIYEGACHRRCLC